MEALVLLELKERVSSPPNIVAPATSEEVEVEGEESEPDGTGAGFN